MEKGSGAPQPGALRPGGVPAAEPRGQVRPPHATKVQYTYTVLYCICLYIQHLMIRVLL